MNALLMRFEAPLMSFGGPVVDSHGPTLLFPGRALLTGLFGNALGYSRSEFDRLDRLQSRIRYAVRRDRSGAPVLDYQTVDLGQKFMSEGGWTTRGLVEERGGANAAATHIRLRHFLADAVYTVALALLPDDDGPTVEDLEQALLLPARTLFLGRWGCIPSGPLVLGRAVAATLAQAVQEAGPVRHRPVDSSPMLARWPHEAGEPEGQRMVAVVDDLDWANRVHVGRRLMREGSLVVAGGAS